MRNTSEIGGGVTTREIGGGVYNKDADSSTSVNIQDGGRSTSVNIQDGGVHANIPRADYTYIQEIMKMMAVQKDNNGHSINDFNAKSSHSQGELTESEEKLVSEASGGKLVFKSGPAKPKLETLTVTQWSMANLSIMHKLLAVGDLASSQVIDYLSYTMRVYLFLSSCELVSVLFFDREYRRLQKQHQFKWGTDIPHLHSVFLRPKFLQGQYSRTTPQTQGSKGVSNKQHLITYASHAPGAKPGSPFYKQAHQQILTEIENGNYIFVNTPPKIISPLGVIPKPDGGVRIIHDCSRPMGSAVNDFAGEFDKQRFQTVDDD
ncbi:unnamed protein product [Mytilus coruscus]|uniref:Uncharacterized protein n=1 Tax=Mytilus coruscus TaxID=42192 RepID=A0A6J8AZL9_MYTCO|nr:unnamed protein product [Mytilus coruscus]